VIIVFARAPLAGRAKTRLIPRLGAWRAARLHGRLVRQALALARAAACGPVELHLDSRHSLYPRARLQRGADLGARMYHAFARALRRHARVILIGSDCPELAPQDLRRADRLLRGACDAVLAPAEDGGYALIALARVSPLLFDEIGWGGAGVYRETLKRIAALGWRARALRTLWDVDRPEDLARLRWRRSASGPGRGARR
jgi:rSAM/selenodomain-associated transferase 1